MFLSLSVWFLLQNKAPSGFEPEVQATWGKSGWTGAAGCTASSPCKCKQSKIRVPYWLQNIRGNMG